MLSVESFRFQQPDLQVYLPASYITGGDGFPFMTLSVLTFRDTDIVLIPI